MDLFHSIRVSVSCINSYRRWHGLHFVRSKHEIFSVKFDPLSTNCRYFFHKMTLFIYQILYCYLFEFEKNCAFSCKSIVTVHTKGVSICTASMLKSLSSSFSFLPHSAAASTIMPEYIILLIKSNDYND